MKNCFNKPKVIVLLGVSGVGKSTLMNYFERNLAFDAAPKFTTRKKREDLDEDLRFLFCDSPIEFPNNTLVFSSYGEYFGIQIERISDSLNNGRNHILTLGDPTTVKRIKEIFGDSVIVIYIYCEYNVLSNRFSSMLSVERKERWNTVNKELKETYNWLDVVDFVLDCSLPFSITEKKLPHLIQEIRLLDSGQFQDHVIVKF